MIMAHVIFYIFAVLAVLSSLAVIFSNNSVKAALFLVGTFVCCSALWIILTAQFLGLILILVYVGAVMTLFLFVVMMLNLEPAKTKGGLALYTPGAVILIAVIFGLLLFAIKPAYFGLSHYAAPAAQAAGHSNVKALGMVLYTQYVLAFELAGVILFVAIVAAIALAFRGKQQRKGQNPSEQLKACKQDRLRIVDMPAEEK